MKPNIETIHKLYKYTDRGGNENWVLNIETLINVYTLIIQNEQTARTIRALLTQCPISIVGVPTANHN